MLVGSCHHTEKTVIQTQLKTYLYAKRRRNAQSTLKYMKTNFMHLNTYFYQLLEFLRGFLMWYLLKIAIFWITQETTCFIDHKMGCRLAVKMMITTSCNDFEHVDIIETCLRCFTLLNIIKDITTQKSLLLFELKSVSHQRMAPHPPLRFICILILYHLTDYQQASKRFQTLDGQTTYTLFLLKAFWQAGTISPPFSSKHRTHVFRSAATGTQQLETKESIEFGSLSVISPQVQVTQCGEKIL